MSEICDKILKQVEKGSEYCLFFLSCPVEYLMNNPQEAEKLCKVLPEKQKIRVDKTLLFFESTDNQMLFNVQRQLGFYLNLSKVISDILKTGADELEKLQIIQDLRKLKTKPETKSYRRTGINAFDINLKFEEEAINLDFLAGCYKDKPKVFQFALENFCACFSISGNYTIEKMKRLEMSLNLLRQKVITCIQNEKFDKLHSSLYKILYSKQGCLLKSLYINFFEMDSFLNIEDDNIGEIKETNWKSSRNLKIKKDAFDSNENDVNDDKDFNDSNINIVSWKEPDFEVNETFPMMMTTTYWKTGSYVPDEMISYDDNTGGMHKWTDGQGDNDVLDGVVDNIDNIEGGNIDWNTGGTMGTYVIDDNGRDPEDWNTGGTMGTYVIDDNGRDPEDWNAGMKKSEYMDLNEDFVGNNTDDPFDWKTDLKKSEKIFINDDVGDPEDWNTGMKKSEGEIMIFSFVADDASLKRGKKEEKESKKMSSSSSKKVFKK